MKGYHFDDGRIKKSYFGCEAYILYDVKYGLSIRYKLESGNVSEVKTTHKFIDRLAAYKLKKRKNLITDKGYNDSKIKYLGYDKQRKRLRCDLNNERKGV